MRRRLLRWFRVTMPSQTGVIGFSFAYVLIEVIHFFVLWKFGPAPGRDWLHVRDVGLIAAAGLYGVDRVLSFHPLYLPEYRRWLIATPWTSRKALPNGPVHLVLQDGAHLGLLVLLMHDAQFNPLCIPLAFLFTYLVALGHSFWHTGVAWAGYLVAFGLGLVVWLPAERPWKLLTAALVYFTAFLGLRRALAGFPWSLGAYEEATSPKALLELMTLSQVLTRRGLGAIPRADLGWPFDRIPPRPPPRGIGYLDACLISLLCGWWTYVILSFFPDGSLALLLFIMLSFPAFSRLHLYCAGHRPPISLWGRLAKFRWIIPSHDRVYVAPLLAVVAGMVLHHQLHRVFAFSVPFSTGVTVVLVFLILLTTGPTYERWTLTGNNRIVPGFAKAKDVEEI